MVSSTNIIEETHHCFSLEEEWLLQCHRTLKAGPITAEYLLQVHNLLDSGLKFWEGMLAEKCRFEAQKTDKSKRRKSERAYAATAGNKGELLRPSPLKQSATMELYEANPETAFPRRKVRW